MANLADVKNELSRFIAQVRRGERVRILVRGIPAADLVPIDPTSGAGDVDSELAELERAGLIRRGTSSEADDRELTRPGPRVRGSAVAALLSERRAGR